MGMYDSVMVKCFNCGKNVEFQSKAGKCRLDKFLVRKVPTEIAIDLHGTIEVCKKCGTKIQLSIPEGMLFTKMFVDDPEEDAEEN